MRIGFAPSPVGERYLISKKEGRRLAQAAFPDLRLLAFQCIHSVRASERVLYVATFRAESFIRVLSVREEVVNEDIQSKFQNHVFPFVLQRAKYHSEVMYRWPRIIVGVNNSFYNIPCSDGWQFPTFKEAMERIDKKAERICDYI